MQMTAEYNEQSFVDPNFEQTRPSKFESSRHSSHKGYDRRLKYFSIFATSWCLLKIIFEIALLIKIFIRLAIVDCYAINV